MQKLSQKNIEKTAKELVAKYDTEVLVFKTFGYTRNLPYREVTALRIPHQKQHYLSIELDFTEGQSFRVWVISENIIFEKDKAQCFISPKRMYGFEFSMLIPEGVKFELKEGVSYVPIPIFQDSEKLIELLTAYSNFLASDLLKNVSPEVILETFKNYLECYYYWADGCDLTTSNYAPPVLDKRNYF